MAPSSPSSSAGSRMCFYCGLIGHFNYDCPNPYTKCIEKGRCVIPLKHPTFIKACKLRQHMTKGHLNHKLKHSRKTSPTLTIRSPTPHPEYIEPTMEPSKAVPVMGSLLPRVTDRVPPADSLLFSLNLQSITQDFQPSPYQAAPIGGMWGNGQWSNP
jgi:hypothetical protein